MRVWLLTSELAPEVAGGIATYVETFSRLLHAGGHDVTIFAPALHASGAAGDFGPRVIGVPYPPPAPRPDAGARARGSSPDAAPHPYDVLFDRAALSHAMASTVLEHAAAVGAPDVVESQEFLGLPYYLLLRMLTERTPLETTPVLLHLHSPDFEIARVNQEPRYHFPRYWIGQMEKFSIVAADGILSPSRFLGARVEEILARPLGIAHIPYPLVLPTPGVLEVPRRGELVHVGRLEVRKGVLPLVGECDRLWTAGEDFRLTLIGEDLWSSPWATTMGALLAGRYGHRLEQGRLRLPGRLPRHEVLRQVQRSWAVLVPSLWDNFPNTCMEAMGLGQVVLASRAGGQAEMIGDATEAGIVFDWGVPGDLPAQLRRVLHLDEQERQAIGERARRRIHDLCAPEKIVEERLAHYERLVARRSARALFPVVMPAHGTAPAACGDRGRAALLSVIIVVPAAGGDATVAAERVRQASYAPTEIVLVRPGERGTVRPGRTAAHDTAAVQLREVWSADGEPAAAERAGVAESTGEFLSVLRPDDIVEPDFFARAITVLERWPNVCAVYSWVRQTQPGGAPDVIWPTWTTELPLLLGRPMVPAVAVMRRDAWARMAAPDVDPFRDPDHVAGWLDLVQAGGVGVSLPHPLVRSSRAPHAAASFGPDALLHLFDVTAHRHDALYRAWGVELANLLYANGPGHRWRHPGAIPPIPGVDVPSAYDAELGGRIVAHLRRTWPGRLLARHPALLRALKRLVGG
jgi:glycosyltransferase involved in cell wall biosynthesis